MVCFKKIYDLCNGKTHEIISKIIYKSLRIQTTIENICYSNCIFAKNHSEIHDIFELIEIKL